jgi:hypothetical protein
MMTFDVTDVKSSALEIFAGNTRLAGVAAPLRSKINLFSSSARKRKTSCIKLQWFKMLKLVYSGQQVKDRFNKEGSVGLSEGVYDRYA